jgi:hypothetical protein
MSTATYPPGTDLMRPKQARDLQQRPASTSMQLVHTEVLSQAPIFVYSADANSVSHARAACWSSPATGPMTAAMAASSLAPETEKC